MQTALKPGFLRASTTPKVDIDLITPSDVADHLKQYHSGHERFMNAMPVLEEGDELLQEKIALTKSLMQHMAEDVGKQLWITENMPSENGFDRTILAIEEPYMIDHQFKEGNEIILARWGTGFTSPIHGHATGYLHEEVIFGKIKVNTYRIVDPVNRIAVPLRTDIVTKGTFVSLFTEQNKLYERQVLVHNFEALEPSATLHFIPEHTRNGTDNAFTTVYFEEAYPDFAKINNDFDRISSEQAMYSRIGDVILVRSENVPGYKDHYIVITGHAVIKEHGLRPQDVAIPAGIKATTLLNSYEMKTGLILLKLSKWAKRQFLEFHNIEVTPCGKVILPAS